MTYAELLEACEWFAAERAEACAEVRRQLAEVQETMLVVERLDAEIAARDARIVELERLLTPPG